MGGKSRKGIGTGVSHAFDDAASEFAASLTSGLYAQSKVLSGAIVKIVFYREQTTITPVEAWVFTAKLSTYERSKSALQLDCGHSSPSIPQTIDDGDQVLEPLVLHHSENSNIVDTLDWGDSGLPITAYYNELGRAIRKALDELQSTGIFPAEGVEIEIIDDEGERLSDLSEKNENALRRATSRLPLELHEDLASRFYRSKERQAWFLQLTSPAKGSSQETLDKVGPEEEQELTKAIARFMDDDEDIRFVAAEELATLGDKALPALLGFLTHENLLLRRDAAEALGEIGSLAAGLPLATLLLSDEDEEVRGEAATALGRIGDSSHACALNQALKDASEFVREEAANALEKFSSED